MELQQLLTGLGAWDAIATPYDELREQVGEEMASYAADDPHRKEAGRQYARLGVAISAYRDGFKDGLNADRDRFLRGFPYEDEYA